MVHDRIAERALLRESAERFVARSYGIDAREALARGVPGFSLEHWATFAELGWLMMRIPEDLGGIGAPFADAAVVLEAFGAGLLLEPFTPVAILSVALLAQAGAAPAAAALLEAIGEGTARVVTAYREAGNAAGIDAPATRLAAREGDLQLDGTKVGVPYAASSDTLLVTARDERGRVVLVTVGRGRPGVTVDEERTLDGGRSATVTFSGVRIDAGDILSFDDPAHAIERALDQADAALCAEAVGVMSRAYDDAAAHVRERLQFGRPLATFQTVRHRIADMYVERELARAAAALAADAIDAAAADCDRRISMAKLQVVRSGRFICENAVQLHGAIGIAAEAAPAHALARITAIGATFGDVVFHRNRYLATREGLLL